MFLSEKATPELVRLARVDAGGLICTAISEELRHRLGLPFTPRTCLRVGRRSFPILGLLRLQQLRYDQRSAFGITVNHRTNFTGVPDNDRAVTIRSALGDLARDAAGLSDDRALRQRFVDGVHLPRPSSDPLRRPRPRAGTKGPYGAGHLAGPDGWALGVRHRLRDARRLRGRPFPEAARKYADRARLARS